MHILHPPLGRSVGWDGGGRRVRAGASSVSDINSFADDSGKTSLVYEGITVASAHDRHFVRVNQPARHHQIAVTSGQAGD
ncbi:hypothetical protein C0Q70_09494 [Pomacea canaliculata]|uniref:Uncharacterized protein n=1 Tax=Pomacea canaliculata TaxID=400727 RepID=A0A2T7P9Z0_POMCA|nr:hypothetical protein C0Q70_09494 [Pomacea canaliculata]